MTGRRRRGVATLCLILRATPLKWRESPRSGLPMTKISFLHAGLVAIQPIAWSAASASDFAEIVVTAQRPGASLRDHVPAGSESLQAAELRNGATDVLRALDMQAPGVTLDEAQANPYQPNLLYRGYEASPLGGNAQGIAVYVDGGRFNQPFGDTSNWDLLPDIAIRRVTLEGSNPVFGLNALGGALAIDLKSGRDTSGVGGEVAVGRFGKRQFAAEAGGRAGAWSYYVAASVQHDGGWRDHSPSTVHQLYAQVGLEGNWGNVDLRLLGADTDLTGNGTAPVELLAARRSAVFTFPDRTRNRYGRALLSADLDLGGDTHLHPIVYVQRFRQRTANGDLSDAEPCDGEDMLLCLAGDPDAPLTGGDGATFPAFADDDTYAQLNATHSRTTGYGASVELQRNEALAGMPNRLSLGASWDGSRTRFGATSRIGSLAEDRGFADGQGIIDMVDGPIRPVSVATRRDDIGVYAADVLTPLAGLDVILAARFNHARVDLDDQLGEAISGRHAFSRLDPAAGIVWRVTPRLSFYGGYAEANRAPTPAELSCADPEAPCSLAGFFLSDPPLHQVVSRTFEAGWRGSGALGGAAVRWRIGGWRATNSDDIIFAASGTRGRAFFRNVGRTRRQGIESEAQLTAGSWTARLSYVLTDATYRTGFVLASPDNPEADANGLITVRPGNRIPGIARHRVKANVRRDFGEVAWVSLDALYSSGRWLLGDEANLTRKTGAYAVVNLAAGIRPAGRFELFGEVRNLFNRRYATFGGFAETGEVDFSEAPGIADPRALSPAAPRTWLIGARLPL